MPVVNIEDKLAKEIETLILRKKEELIEEASKRVELHMPYKDLTLAKRVQIEKAFEDLSKSISATLLR
jgi:hypothetical protein